MSKTQAFKRRVWNCKATDFNSLTLKKKKLFCAFIDFEKAFDTVWREGVWYKLLMCNIKGKMYDIILNLYNNIKSRIV